MKSNIERFITAQESSYEQALNEVKSGRKTSHWMWYIFPQIQGLGYSEIARFYAIADLAGANEYLNHPTLGNRLREITNELLKLENTDANSIFGSPDDLKLKSSMTLFSRIDENGDKIFQQVIEKYFDNKFDQQTIKLVNKSEK